MTGPLIFNRLARVRVERDPKGAALRFFTHAPVPGRGLQELNVTEAEDAATFGLLARLTDAKTSGSDLQFDDIELERLAQLGVVVERGNAPHPVTLLEPTDPRVLALCLESVPSEAQVVSSDDGWTFVGMSPPSPEVVGEFQRRGYAVLPRVLGGADLGRVRAYVRDLADQGFMRLGDEQSVRYVQHNELLSRALHRALAGWVSQLVRTPVKPSYCYLATYLRGARLEEHTDRQQCKYSITLNLDTDPSLSKRDGWPIWVRDAAGQAVPVRLAMGEGLLYLGCERPHFRDALDVARRATSVFLHYVDASFDGDLD